MIGLVLMQLYPAGLSVATQLQSGLIVMVQRMKQVGRTRAVGQELGFQEIPTSLSTDSLTWSLSGPYQEKP